MNEIFYIYQLFVCVFLLYVYFSKRFNVAFDEKIKKFVLLVILFWFLQGLLFLINAGFVYDLLTYLPITYLIFYLFYFYDDKYVNEKEDLYLYYNKPIYKIIKFRIFILSMFWFLYFLAIFYNNKIVVSYVSFLISNCLLFLLFLYGKSRNFFFIIVLNYFIFTVYLGLVCFTGLFFYSILKIHNIFKLYVFIIPMVFYYPFFYIFCRYIQKFYFNKIKNYQFTLGRFFKKIVLKLTIKNIAEEVNNILCRELDVEFSAFYCFEKKSNKYVLIDYKGKEISSADDFVKDEIFDYIKGPKNLIFDFSKYINFDSKLKKIIQNKTIKIIVPIFLNDEFLGCIFLGKKKNKIDFDYYSYNEISFLKEIIYYTAIALVNIMRYDTLKNSYWNSVRTLANAIEAKDVYTCGHSERVVEYSLILGREMGMPEKKLDLLRFGGILHDIGKIAIDDEIIKKDSKLSNIEQQIIRSHPIEGEKMVSPITFLKDVRYIIRHHHERWDGTGYPDGLFKDEIPALARIVQIVDTFDAITSSRSYRSRQTMEVAVEEIKKFSGTQFDPAIVYYFLRAYKKGLFEKFKIE